MTTNINMFCQTKKMNNPFLASKKDISFLPLTKKNDLFCSTKRIDLLHAAMRSVLSCRFSFEYKNEGLFYNDCGCDLDPSIIIYNNCDDDFPNQNDFDVSLFIPDNNSAHDLCACSFILILKKVKKSIL